MRVTEHPTIGAYYEAHDELRALEKELQTSGQAHHAEEVRELIIISARLLIKLEMAIFKTEEKTAVNAGGE